MTDKTLIQERTQQLIDLTIGFAEKHLDDDGHVIDKRLFLPKIANRAIDD